MTLSNKKQLLVAATNEVTEAFRKKNAARQVWEELKKNECAADASVTDKLSCASKSDIENAKNLFNNA